MNKGTQGKAEGQAEESQKKRIFKNFAEYWHYVKVLSQDQREILVQSLSIQERRSLHASFKRGGWNDLMMRNTCDQILAAIKTNVQIDLLDLRVKIVVQKKSQLIQKGLWEHINRRFENIKWEHISYIFDGIIAEDYDEDYVKLSSYK